MPRDVCVWRVSHGDCGQAHNKWGDGPLDVVRVSRGVPFDPHVNSIYRVAATSSGFGGRMSRFKCLVWHLSAVWLWTHTQTLCVSLFFLVKRGQHHRALDWCLWTWRVHHAHGAGAGLAHSQQRAATLHFYCSKSIFFNSWSISIQKGCLPLEGLKHLPKWGLPALKCMFSAPCQGQATTSDTFGLKKKNLCNVVLAFSLTVEMVIAF